MQSYGTMKNTNKLGFGAKVNGVDLSDLDPDHCSGARRTRLAGELAGVRQGTWQGGCRPELLGRRGGGEVAAERVGSTMRRL